MLQYHRPLTTLSPNMCLTCCSSYLFLHSSPSNYLQNKLFKIFWENWVLPKNLHQFLLIIFKGFNFHKQDKILWKCWVFAILQCLWVARNARIFKRTSLSLNNIWDRVIFLASLWCFANGLFRGVSLLDIQRLACLVIQLNLSGPIFFLLLSSSEDTILSLCTNSETQHV